MKKLFITLMLVVALCLILPKIFGGIVKEEYHNTIAQLNEHPAINAKINNFTLSWFSGTARSEITFIIAEDDIEEVSIIIEDTLDFGPIILANEKVYFGMSHINSSVKLNTDVGEFNQLITDFISKNVKMTSLFTFSKDIVSTIEVASINETIDGETISSKPAYGEFTLANMRSFEGAFNWGGLTISQENSQVEIGALSFESQQQAISGNYFQGDTLSTGFFKLHLDSLVVNEEKDAAVLTMNGLSLIADTRVDDDLMEVSVVYHVDKLTSAGEEFTNADFDLKITRLDVETMQEVNSIFADLTNNIEQLSAQNNMMQLTALAEKLIIKEPQIIVENLSVETPEGKVKSDLIVTIDKDIFDAKNIMSLMTAMSAKANGSSPEALLSKYGLDAAVNQYIQQGLLMRDKTELRFNALFTKGQLEVNGKSVPLF